MKRLSNRTIWIIASFMLIFSPPAIFGIVGLGVVFYDMLAFQFGFDYLPDFGNSTDLLVLAELWFILAIIGFILLAFRH